jgi:hypothetical protein
LATIGIKPPHKFFEGFPPIDNESLYDFLINIEKDMIDGKFPNIPANEAQELVDRKSNLTQAMLDRYNIFALHHPELRKLYGAVRDLTKEACEYYGVDFYNESFYIQGWVNIEGLYDSDLSDDDSVTDEELHDHCGGLGYPDFHGYYCVFAEPSVTHYNIDRVNRFRNINKNGRAILSETGHPHARGHWPNKIKRRMTIAYDTRTITKSESIMSDLSQHWIPLI